MRCIMLAATIAGATLFANAAHAQEPSGPSDNARYTFHRMQDHFLRLDTRTGRVSDCSWGASGWFCRVVPDERLALESEIARLVAGNAALKKELLVRGLPLPDGIKPDPPIGERSNDIALPEAERDGVKEYIEKVWRRLVEMMSNLQRDMLRKS